MKTEFKKANTMICLRCNNLEFAEQPHAVIEQEFRGETLKVVTPAMSCTKCGWTTVVLEQIDQLRNRTADTYRKKHGLLTSSQIKRLRAALNMTQREFADFLRVGEASVKRWETWCIQDASSDELLRAKCVLEKKDLLITGLKAKLAGNSFEPVELEHWKDSLEKAKVALGLKTSLTLPTFQELLVSSWHSWPDLVEPCGEEWRAVVLRPVVLTESPRQLPVQTVFTSVFREESKSEYLASHRTAHVTKGSDVGQRKERETEDDLDVALAA